MSRVQQRIADLICVLSEIGQGTATDAKSAAPGWPAARRMRIASRASPSVRAMDGKVLVHCHAGCAQRDVIAALRGLGLWETIGTSEGLLGGKHHRRVSDEATRGSRAYRGGPCDLASIRTGGRLAGRNLSALAWTASFCAGCLAVPWWTEAPFGAGLARNDSACDKGRHWIAARDPSNLS